jgi:CHAT domain-containing protein
MLGLRRGFQVAGAQAQIVSLWQVDGEATAALMTLFYRDLVRGATIAEALCAAQLELASHDIAPMYWAGFTLFGVGDVPGS